MIDNTCMLCGAIIPEGRHICLTCEGTDDLATFRQIRKHPETNGERIRRMTDEDLATFLVTVAGLCAAGFRDHESVRVWLGEEAKT